MQKNRIIYFVLFAPLWVCGQTPVDMSAPVRVTNTGSVTSVNYGLQNRFRPNVRYMASEERYVRSAWGLLPSEDRYVRHASGQLPSQGRYAPMTSYYPNANSGESLVTQTQTAIGSLRYHTPPSQKLVKQRDGTQENRSTLGRVPLTTPGSDKYGASKSTFANQPNSSFSELHSSRKTSVHAPSISQQRTVIKQHLKTTGPNYLNGSLRYSR